VSQVSFDTADVFASQFLLEETLDGGFTVRSLCRVDKDRRFGFDHLCDLRP